MSTDTVIREPSKKEVPSLAGRAASSAVWLGSVTIIGRLVGLLSQWLLARLLIPQQTGTFMLVQTITMFAHHLTYPGIDDVLVQKSRRLNRWTPAAFWLSIVCGFGGGMAMVALGFVVVSIAQQLGNAAYGDPTLLKMIAIFAIGAPLNGSALVPFVALKANLRFAEVAAVALFELVAQQGLIVFFAWKGFGAFSFVIPMPIVAGARSALLWLLARPRITWHMGFHRWPSLVSSTRWVLGQRILATGVHQGDQIVVGAIFADQSRNGIYGFAVLLTQQVVRLMCENLLHVLVPVLSSFHDDRQRVESAVARACRVLGAMIIPLVTLQILLAKAGFVLLFPPKWNDAIVLVQWLSCAPLIFASAYPMMSMILATGRFRAYFVLAFVNVVTFYVMVIGGAMIGENRSMLAPVAIAVALWSWWAAHLYAIFAFKSIHGIRVMYESIWRSLASAAVAAIPGFLFLHWFAVENRTQACIAIVSVSLLVLGVYMAVMRMLDPETLSTVQHRFGGVFGSILRRVLRRRPAAA